MELDERSGALLIRSEHGLVIDAITPEEAVNLALKILAKLRPAKIRQIEALLPDDFPL